MARFEENGELGKRKVIGMIERVGQGCSSNQLQRGAAQPIKSTLIDKDDKYVQLIQKATINEDDHNKAKDAIQKIQEMIEEKKR